MKRLCPACFTELTQEANQCPVCGKCMREPVEQSSQYVGGVPVTTVIKMNDCAIHIGVSGIGLEENKYKPQEVNKVEKYIEALKGISYFEWIKLREGMDNEFNRLIGESKRSLQLTDSENVKRIIRSRFGGKLD